MEELRTGPLHEDTTVSADGDGGNDFLKKLAEHRRSDHRDVCREGPKEKSSMLVPPRAGEVRGHRAPHTPWVAFIDMLVPGV